MTQSQIRARRLRLLESKYRRILFELDDVGTKLANVLANSPIDYPGADPERAERMAAFVLDARKAVKTTTKQRKSILSG